MSFFFRTDLCRRWPQTLQYFISEQSRGRFWYDELAIASDNEINKNNPIIRSFNYQKLSLIDRTENLPKLLVHKILLRRW